MKVECPGCHKAYDIPDERLTFGKKISFPCPACKAVIDIDLRSKTKEGEETGEEAQPLPPDEELPKGEVLQKRILRRVTELPPMPQVMFKAREVMNNPASSFKELADILETDQALATRVLRLANSAYYGLAGKVSTVQHASVLLGYKTLGEIVSMAGSSKLLGNSLDGYKLDSGELWRHSLAVALSSRIIALKTHPDLADNAFAAGLIHDAGKIVLDKYILERNDQFETFMSDGQKTFLDAEKDILGFDHSEIAAEICKTWKIPKPLINAISFHHYPSRSREDTLSFIVHVADSLSLMSGIGTGIDGMLYKMEGKAMELLGLDEEDLSNIIDETVESVEKIASQMQ